MDGQALVEKAAAALQKVDAIKAPSWAGFVKTGVSRERPPMRADWWQVRAASVLRVIYLSQGPIGVNKLRVKYGSRKNRGYKPDAFFEGSGNIIRKVLQQLDKAGFTKQAEKGVHKGRIITPAGKSFLDKIATEMAKKA